MRRSTSACRRTARGGRCLPPAGAAARQAHPERPAATAAIERPRPRPLPHRHRRNPARPALPPVAARRGPANGNAPARSFRRCSTTATALCSTCTAMSNHGRSVTPKSVKTAHGAVHGGHHFRTSPNELDFSVPDHDEVAAIRNRLAALRAEQAALEARLTELDTERSNGQSPASGASPVTALSSPAEKVALFRSLFRGREDVFPKR